jgi:hypothetical protein
VTLKFGVAELIGILRVAVGRQGSDALLPGPTLHGAEDELVAAVFAFDYPGLTGAIGELSSHDVESFQRGCIVTGIAERAVLARRQVDR